MECREALFLIALYPDGELAETDAAALKRHAAGCAECARALALQKRVSGALRELGREEVPAPPGLAAAVTEKLRDGHKKPLLARLPASWRTAAAAAAAALLIAGSSLGIHTGLQLAGDGGKTVGYQTPPAGVENPDGGIAGPGETPEGGLQTPEGSGTAGEPPGADTSGNAPAGTGDAGSETQAGPAAETGSGNEAAQADSGDTNPATGINPAGNGSSAPEETRAFVSSKIAVNSTLLKVTAAEPEKAKDQAVSLAAAAGAQTEVFPEQSAGKKVVVVRITAPAGGASGLLAQLGRLGAVFDRQDESRDVTTLYHETMVQYRELQSRLENTADGAERRQLEQQAAAYRQQLDAWEAEAGKHVIMLWLESA
jgi:hypothetical protein